MDKWVVGERCKINEGLKEAIEKFEQAGCEWKDKYQRYLGHWAEVIALFMDKCAMLRMDNGKEYKFPLDCIHREGVTNLVRKDADTNWPKEVVKKHEAELLEQLEKLKQSEQKEESDSDRSVSSLEKHKSRKKRRSLSSSPKLSFKKGDIVNAKFKDELRQGTVTAVDFENNPPYEVYLDSVGVTYMMHPHELRKCENPTNYLNQTADSKLTEFLKSFNLLQHLKGLVDEGFETLDDLDNAEMEDLQVAGLKRGHARRLQRALKESRENPASAFDEINQRLQRRPSFCNHRDSLINALAATTQHEANPLSQFVQPNYGQPNQIGIGSVSSLYNQPYHIPAEFQSPSPNFQDYSQAAAYDLNMGHFPDASQPPPPSHRRRTSIWEDDGYLIVKFDARPLGFGIMSPLFVGTMISTITEPKLKDKGLGLGLPLLSINNVDVASEGLETVANILSRVELPFSITFGLQPYFKTGQKVMVSKNNKWYPASVLKMSKSSRKVTVKFDNSPFRFSNTDKIADYNRIRNISDVLDQERGEAIKASQQIVEDSGLPINTNQSPVFNQGLLHQAYRTEVPVSSDVRHRQNYELEYQNIPYYNYQIPNQSEPVPVSFNVQSSDLRDYATQDNRYKPSREEGPSNQNKVHHQAYVNELDVQSNSKDRTDRIEANEVLEKADN